MTVLLFNVPDIIRGLRENLTGLLTVIAVMFGVLCVIGLCRHLLGCEDESSITEDAP